MDPKLKNENKTICTAKYSFTVDPIKKKVSAKASGKFDVITASNYIVEYKELVESIDPTQYSFTIDAHKQEKCEGEVAKLLEIALKLYMGTPWKSRTYVCLSEFYANTQVLCLAGNSFLDKFIIKKESLEEDYNSTELQAIRMEFKAIIEDIKANPKNIEMYDLENMYYELRTIEDNRERSKAHIPTKDEIEKAIIEIEQYKAGFIDGRSF